MPETHYAKSEDVNIAYQVKGGAPRDIVYVPGWVSNVEVMWEEPAMANFLNRLASFSRLIIFDKRGTGMSDRVSADRLPTLEVRMDDLRTVMDDVGSDKPTLLGHSEGGNMCSLFSATYPERVEKLILVASYAKRIWSKDYPWAPTPEQREKDIAETERSWGDPKSLVMYMASSLADDEAFKNWIARYCRLSASPTDAATLLRMNTEIDTRLVLPSIYVPTMCIYKTGDLDVNIEEGRWITSQIPNSTFVEIEGGDHWLAAGGAEELLDNVEEFVTGRQPKHPRNRVLTTLLFTDIVGSTAMASQMGDRAWRELLRRHHAAVRSEIRRYRGEEISTTGDGFLAMFDGPARAVRAAQAMTEVLKPLGLEIRAGLHTGEVELVDDDVAGLSVHIGSRIANLGGPGEVLVSRTVKDLVAGSGIEFADHGTHQLKGIPDKWQVYLAVA